MPTKKKSVDFEQSLTDLEALVTRMEQGELSLEESLKAFEQGIQLTRSGTPQRRRAAGADPDGTTGADQPRAI